eukprot:TRINITY_DN2806_c0_g2_i2.p1 TRINITY_DN2806_c0_g2~~TRINITY_DN2806_c0_g2_i2.p1  ORF type:complete len:161 (+),score=19.77 TRINITY_DN2806_c0_g2_i2:2-484(+)
MEGLLFKKGQDVIGLWRTRYFREENDKLYYFKTKDTPKPSGFISLAEVTSVSIVEDNYGRKGQFGFKIGTSSGRFYNLCAPNQKDRDKWIKALLKHVRSIDSLVNTEPIIRISNSTAYTIKLFSFEVIVGTSSTQPPDTIPPQSEIEFVCVCTGNNCRRS